MMAPYDRETAMTSLLKAIPYIRLFRGRTFVLKLGGGACTDPVVLRTLTEQCGVLRELGIRVVLVHGGGAQTNALCERLGIETRTVEGRRVTSSRALEAVIMAINGTVNTAILAACRAVGLSAVGVSGVDAGLVRARQRPPLLKEVDGRMVEIDYGEVGDITEVDASVLERLAEAGFVPVVGSLAADDAGRVLNVNADTVAAAVAAALAAEKLIFLTEVPGLLEDPDDPSSLVSYLDLPGLAALEGRGAVREGMLPKVAAIRQALAGGVGRVHLVGARERWGVLVEVFTNEGAGTMVVRSIAELAPGEQGGQAKAGAGWGG